MARMRGWRRLVRMTHRSHHRSSHRHRHWSRPRLKPVRITYRHHHRHGGRGRRNVRAWNRLFKSLGKKTRIGYAKYGYSRRYNVVKKSDKKAHEVAKSKPKITNPILAFGESASKTVKDLVKQRDEAWKNIISGKDRSPFTIAKAVGLSLLPIDLANTIRKAVQGEKVTAGDVVSAGLDLIFLPLRPVALAGNAIKNVAKSVVKAGVKVGEKMGFGALGRFGLRFGEKIIPRLRVTIKPIGLPKLIRPTIKPLTTAGRRIANKRILKYGAIGLGAFGAGALIGARKAQPESKPQPKPQPVYVPQPVAPYIMPVVQPVEQMAQKVTQPLENVPVVGGIFAEANKRGLALPLTALIVVGGYLAYKKYIKKR